VAESSAPNSLPSIRDRLPDLVLAMEETLRQLAIHHRPQILAWDRLYQTVHSVKGLLNILPCEVALRDFLLQFNLILSQLVEGICAPKQPSSSGETLQEMVAILNATPLDYTLEKSLKKFKDSLVKTETQNLPLPFTLHYPDPKVNARWQEAARLSYSILFVEDNILLQQIPEWKTKLAKTIDLVSGELGFVIHTMPFIFADSSRNIKLWTCLAIPQTKFENVKNEIKSQFPKATITNLAK
jgi:hypothetical protein